MIDNYEQKNNRRRSIDDIDLEVRRQELFKISVGNFYIPFIVTDRTGRIICKNIEVMKNIMNQLELIDIFGILDPQLQNEHSFQEHMRYLLQEISCNAIKQVSLN